MPKGRIIKYTLMFVLKLNGKDSRNLSLTIMFIFLILC